MARKINPFLLLSLGVLLLMSTPSFAGITFNENQVEIAIAPTCNHVPVSIPYIPTEFFDDTVITVSSDSNWAIPSVNSDSDSIDISFATESLVVSYTATISVDDGENVTELFIYPVVSPLNVYRLLDDPLRSITYGIQRNGVYNGSIFAFDPVQESLISCITVGEGPTDFVINDDSTELLVINSVGKTIDVIDLETFSLKETINLPTYGAWGSASDTTANIDLGPEGIIYYVDGSWGPVFHVLKRSTEQVLQSIIFNGSSPTNNTGFMDFAVTSDKTKMVAMPQFGWSAGSHSAKIGQFTINNDGTVNFVKETSLLSFNRDPFEAPVLMRDDDQIAVMKTISTDPANTDNLDRVFPSAIWSMNPNGSVVATGNKLYDYETGLELYTIPNASISGSGYTYTKAQAFTSDYTRFVYFNSSNRTLNVVNLVNEIGLELLGRSVNPNNGAVVTSPETLIWAPLSGVDQYDVYLGSDYSTIAAADETSPFYIGRITGTDLSLAEILVNGTEYFWRIDPVTALGPEIGTVYNFTVSDIALDITDIDVQTVAGHDDFQVDIQLTSQESGVSWSVLADDDWVTFTESTGSTPSTLSVHLDASILEAGFHNSSITLMSEAGELQIPVQIEVEPLHVTHIRSDKNSEMVYAISEDTSSIVSRAYLLEIDSDSETIERVTPVGSSVTDFTIHYADDLIYVTNWKSGNLLAIDIDTFEHVKNHAFQPAGATGYSEGDVYRVAAGVSQRLVVEEEDQWIDISFYNTNTEAAVASAFVREGGGAFDPTGRYYYHGENNSSGAAIIKYDTSGDAFTQLASIRPQEMSSYYGSRTVIVSEDGSRIFWAGVALDQSLQTVWRVGEIVYSTTSDGRYAFADSAIYDVNLKRQVLSMPSGSHSVSGYNSTSEKLIVQVGENLEFFVITTPISFPAPLLSIDSLTQNSIGFSWTDKSLEMTFVVQQREFGSSTWTDIRTLSADETNWTATNLQENTTYEFRVRANTPDYSSPWSNIGSATTLPKPNVVPTAVADFVILPAIAEYRFSITENDTDLDGEIDPDSIRIMTQPQFGQITVNTGGEVTYIPDNDFIQTDSFNYTIDDDDAASSSQATVTLIFLPTPVLSTSEISHSSIKLSWTDDSLEIGYSVQQRLEGTSNWFNIRNTSANVVSWTAINLQENSIYEFRVRANYSGYSSLWSNTATVTTLTKPNEAPVAVDDIIMLPTIVESSFNITGNDRDYDGEIDSNSIEIVTQPAFGQVIIHTGGEVTYIPSYDFTQTDSFSYTIDDNEAQSSQSATVTLIFNPAPVLSASNLDGPVELNWTNASQGAETGFVIQQRLLGSSIWNTIQYTAANVSSWTVFVLQANLTYEFRVRANYTSYSSPWSNVIPVTTFIAPSPVLSISKVNYDSIELSWADELFEFGFVVQQRQLGSNTWATIANTTAGVASWTATGLQQGLIYEFRIRSNDDDNSPWSNVAVAIPTATQEPEPEPITIVKKEEIGSFDMFSIMLFALVLLLLSSKKSRIRKNQST